MIYVVCVNKVLKENIEPFLKAALEHASISKSTDKGCLRFDVSKYNEMNNEIVFFELWESKESLDKHTNRCRGSELLKVIQENRYNKNLNIYEIL